MKIEFSAGNVAKSTAVIILLVLLSLFLYEIRSILVVFFVAFLFASALDPSIDYLQKKKIPRGISAILIFIFLFIILGIIISSIVPIIITQIGQLISSLKDFVTNINTETFNDIPILSNFIPYIKQFFESVDFSQIEQSLTLVKDQLANIGGNIWEALKSIGNGLFNIIMALILIYFMIVEEEGIDKFILSLFPEKYAKYITTRVKKAKEKIGYWLRGQLILSLTIGILAFIGFLILGVNYAVTLALIAAVTELIPYLGPIIAWVITVPIAANQSGWLVLSITILFIIIQVLENNLIVPLVMKRAVGLSPIVITFALLVGAHFLQVIGIILSIPVATTISIFLKDYMDRRNQKIE